MKIPLDEDWENQYQNIENETVIPISNYEDELEGSIIGDLNTDRRLNESPTLIKKIN